MTDITQWLYSLDPSAYRHTSDDNDTPLMYAALYGHLPLVQWIVKEGKESIHDRNKFGHTVLLCGRCSVLSTCFFHNTFFFFFWILSDLLSAADGGHLDIVKWLLTEGGSSVSERALNGESAFLLASFQVIFSKKSVL